MAKKKAPATTAPAIAYKGFDKDLSCRGFQYEIGKTYIGTKPVVRCGEGGFHSCAMPLDVWNYYSPATSRLAEVIPGGEIDRDTNSDTKIASAEITVRAELRFPEFIKRAAEWVIAAAKSTVTTGYASHAASTGNRSHAASTGNRSHAASTGYASHAASTGNRSHAASTGHASHAASTGDASHAASTGDASHAASTGYASHAASTGYASHAASTGDASHAASTGDASHAASTGNRSHAEVRGKNSVASSTGINGTASAGKGGAITLAAYDDEYNLVAVFASRVGENGIEAGITYRLGLDGKPVAVSP
jgi:hypothetical protein